MIVAGRDESDFYDALGVVGAGPIGQYTGMSVYQNADGYRYIIAPMLDNQPPHGFKVDGNLNVVTDDPTMGLREVAGTDPATAGYDYFELGQAFTGRYAAGTAFVEIRRVDQKGIQPTTTDEHQMVVPISKGLSGCVWDAAGNRTLVAGLTNPFWVAVNCFLRAQGLGNADSATQLSKFVLSSLVKGDGTGAAEIADLAVAPLVGGIAGTMVVQSAVVVSESGGFSFTSPPPITISGGGGSGATATATVSPDGHLRGVTITERRLGLHIDAPDVRQQRLGHLPGDHGPCAGQQRDAVSLPGRARAAETVPRLAHGDPGLRAGLLHVRIRQAEGRLPHQRFRRRSLHAREHLVPEPAPRAGGGGVRAPDHRVRGPGVPIPGQHGRVPGQGPRHLLRAPAEPADRAPAHRRLWHAVAGASPRRHAHARGDRGYCCERVGQGAQRLLEDDDPGAGHRDRAGRLDDPSGRSDRLRRLPDSTLAASPRLVHQHHGQDGDALDVRPGQRAEAGGRDAAALPRLLVPDSRRHAMGAGACGRDERGRAIQRRGDVRDRPAVCDVGRWQHAGRGGRDRAAACERHQPSVPDCSDHRERVRRYDGRLAAWWPHVPRGGVLPSTPAVC